MRILQVIGIHSPLHHAFPIAGVNQCLAHCARACVFSNVTRNHKQISSGHRCLTAEFTLHGKSFVSSVSSSIQGRPQGTVFAGLLDRIHWFFCDVDHVIWRCRWCSECDHSHNASEQMQLPTSMIAALSGPESTLTKTFRETAERSHRAKEAVEHLLQFHARATRSHQVDNACVLG
jgi:hypothetical protein